MLKPPGSKIVESPTKDRFFQRLIFWVPLAFTSVLVFGGLSEGFLNLRWANALVGGLAEALPSIEKWAQRSYFPPVTKLIFSLAWLFSVFYGV
ncbi:MAG: hypothetical protein KGI95_15820, partial [Pseudomonas sp.]|nr:hypothetical protein [Pseudomonas sp.]